ncbi:MAG TPA: TOMM precursor leader peptide-binding protein, partial [Pseudonocardiaceae bacterium]|nr:TOMM precursor leader peptide-binding protein [Pseudonocardiaceae bacterium]
LPGEHGLTVVLCEDYLAPELAVVDATHRLAGLPWLLAKPTGTQAWLGPIFRQHGACWHCLATRLWGNRQAEAHVQAALGRDGPVPRPGATIPPLAGAAAHLVALEATKWLAGHRHANQEAVWTLDSVDLTGRFHQVRRRPQCVYCGDPDLVRRKAFQPVVLASRRPSGSNVGARRANPPEQVLADYGHLISPVTGLIKEISRDPRGPASFNSFRAGPNHALRTNGLAGLRSALRTESSGKGVTRLDAEVSALCEALERYCGHARGDEATIRESYRQFDDEAIHPDTCQLYDPRQYTDRATWNAAHGPFQRVCDPFDETVVRNWTPVWSLTQQRHRLLPTALLYYGGPRTPGASQLRADSNGNAAGSSVEDAVLHGLLELVERDAVAIWWYNRTRQRAVDIEAFGDHWVTHMCALHTELGREVWVLDVTSDLGVPAMAALSRRTAGPHEDIMLGFGAHPDPAVALRRCVSELNQLMPAVVDTSDDGRYRHGDPDAVRWWRDATIANQPYLAPDPTVPAATPADYGYRPAADIVADIDAIHAKLRVTGLELLVLDQTQPDVGLPVVKVIVPGLRGFWTRFAPGRLFDVPVTLGRLPGPTAYRELNRFPIFL